MKEKKFVLVGVSGGVHPVASLTAQPNVQLTQWCIKESKNSEGVISRHFIGYDCMCREGRVSSDIVEFNPLRLRGKTSSGRIYELCGPSSQNADANYVWAKWRLINRTVNEKDITIEDW
ncbi:MAG TPA: hypothetical protein PL131_10985 [Methylotenera sp.]|nr:hypothetical protein [Methylotenera sp.]HPH06390.1 hypothetical protein [Methylotenera sp.]HPN01834.1 hypothetical protein [Methylotenera sp.]